MQTMQSVQTCRWARPTIDDPPPFWTGAWDYPWTCTADGQIEVLTDITVCETCPRWEPRRDEDEPRPPADA